MVKKASLNSETNTTATTFVMASIFQMSGRNIYTQHSLGMPQFQVLEVPSKVTLASPTSPSRLIQLFSLCILGDITRTSGPILVKIGKGTYEKEGSDECFSENEHQDRCPEGRVYFDNEPEFFEMSFGKDALLTLGPFRVLPVR
jgi:hypothetical protein